MFREYLMCPRTVILGMKHEELTSTIIGICILIHEKLGPGLLESIYEEVICYELRLPLKTRSWFDQFFNEKLKLLF